MQRILEPEVMDGMEEALAYDAMDHHAANASFVTDLLAMTPSPGFWLDLGTGTGQIPLALCRKSDAARILAVDLSNSMLEIARCHVEVAGYIDRIQLECVDAKSLPWEDASFEAVISNSIIHHIPEPELVLREAIRVVRPGGLLFIRDLMRPKTVRQIHELVATYAGQETELAQRMFFESLQAALDLDEIRAAIHRIGFSPNSVYASSDRHWTWSAQQ